MEHITFSEARRNILAALAKGRNIPVNELKPFVHYDPIDIDERAYQASKQMSGVVWTGD